MIWGNQFRDPERSAIAALTSVMFFVYVLLPMQSFAKELTHQAIRRFGNDEEKGLMVMDRALVALQKKVTNASDEDMLQIRALLECTKGQHPPPGVY